MSSCLFSFVDMAIQSEWVRVLVLVGCSSSCRKPFFHSSPQSSWYLAFPLPAAITTMAKQPRKATIATTCIDCFMIMLFWICFTKLICNGSLHNSINMWIKKLLAFRKCRWNVEVTPFAFVARERCHLYANKLSPFRKRGKCLTSQRNVTTNL